MAKIFVSWNIVTTSNVLLIARELANPLAEVYRSPVYTPPHTIRNITIDNLNPVMHQVEIWSTVDGVTLDELKGRCDIDASISNTLALDIVTFIVGRGMGAPNYDPATDSNTYTNPDLDGKTYVVFKPGFGPLQFGYNIQTVSGGGFQFIDGQTFVEEEEYTVLVSNLVSTQNTSSGKSYPEDIVLLPSNVTFGTTHYNKIFLANGGGPITTITITNINTIPNNTKFGVNNQSGTSKYVAIQLPSGVTCPVRAANRNILYIGRGETANFQKKDGALYVINWDGDIQRVGDEVWKAGTPPINSVLATGGWVLKTSEPRLYQYVSELPASDVIAGTDDFLPLAANVAKWGSGTAKFWVPDYGGYFNRAYDPNSDVDTSARTVTGEIQGDLVKTHTHGVAIGNGTSGTAMPDYNPVDGNIQRAVALTSSGITDDSNLALRTGLENRPKNIMKRVYIIT